MTTRSVPVTRLDPSARSERETRDDEVVVEEPLEIRIAGETLAITMRTPGQDEALVLGFLWAEGILRGRADVASIAHCGRTGAEERENTDRKSHV